MDFVLWRGGFAGLHGWHEHALDRQRWQRRQRNTTGAAGNSGPGIGGSGGSTVSGAAGVISIGGSGGGNQMCGLQKFDVERKPAEILLLLDRSKSMIEDTTSDGVTLKWNAVLPALKQVIMDTDAAVSWGLKTFPEGLGAECVTGSVTNNVVVPIAPMNAAAVVGALNDTTNPATQPQGNGTPTGDAITAAFNYLKTLTTTNPKYILLATDGAPSCAGTTKDSSTARTYAYTHVMDAASASPPIYTFVVGVATNSSSETSTLNMLADAGGGRARPAHALLSRQHDLRADGGAGPDHRTGGDLHVPAEPAAAGPERAHEAGHVLSADRQPEDLGGSRANSLAC